MSYDVGEKAPDFHKRSLVRSLIAIATMLA